MAPEEFCQAGHALIDWIADYRADSKNGKDIGGKKGYITGFLAHY